MQVDSGGGETSVTKGTLRKLGIISYFGFKIVLI
jgi:hypothetical protein